MCCRYPKGFGDHRCVLERIPYELAINRHYLETNRRWVFGTHLRSKRSPSVVGSGSAQEGDIWLGSGSGVGLVSSSISPTVQFKFICIALFTIQSLQSALQEIKFLQYIYTL